MKYIIIAALMFAVLAAAPVLAGGEPAGALERLVAKDEIITTVNRLLILTDQMNWPEVQRVFAPKVNFDMTSIGAEKAEVLTPEQITTSWDNGLKHLKAIHHQAGNYMVEFDETGAKVFCYGMAGHYLPNPSGQNVRTFVGSYDMHLVKNGTGWVIDAFKFNLKYIGGNPNLEGK